MAKVTPNPLAENVRGRVGDLVFRQWKGQTYVSARPRSSGRRPTAAQAAHRKRFSRAVEYATAALEDPVLRKYYAARAQPGVTAHNVATADYMRAPEIEEIDATEYRGEAGGTIQIHTSDDVALVSVAICAPGGEALEQGVAVQARAGDASRWVYTVSAAVPPDSEVAIEVSATDRPGNRTVETVAAAVTG